ncbi:MAG: hypothetical protein ACOX87_11325 [Chloroflexota bacterium]|jgi:hypothetical protein
MKLATMRTLLLGGLLLLVTGCSGSATTPTATSVATPAGQSNSPVATNEPTASASKATQPSPTTAAPAATVTTGAAKPTPNAGETPSPSAAAVPAAGEVPRMNSPESGVQVFLWGNPNIGRDLQLVKDAGFTWIKQMFQWNFIERDGKGEFLWNEPDRLVKPINDMGFKLVARIDYQPEWARKDGAHNGPPDNLQDFGDFIYALVSRYKTGSPYGTIHAYEIWNEPNLAREWGNQPPNASEYVQLLKTAYLAAKKADPKAVIVTAGLTPTGTMSNEARPDDVFLEEMYRAGAKDYFDVLGVHAAGFKAPPEMSPDEIQARKELGGQRFFGFRRVEDLRKIMVANGDERKQVMVLEMGWTTDNREGSPYAWHAVTEKEKGEYIVRAYQYAKESWSPWIGAMSTIYICDSNWTPEDEQYYWALTDPNGEPRESYEIIKGKLP